MKHNLFGSNILPPLIVNDFVQFRINAEKLARQKTPSDEVSLSQIYDVFAEKFCLSSNIRDFLIDLEKDRELSSISGVPSILGIIDSLRSLKKRVIFTSDTYLPKDLIECMLRKVGALKTGDKLYVSSDCLLSKASGKLFNYILKAENISNDEIVHVGDNPLSDIKSAKHLGIRTFHFKETKLTRYEYSMCKKDKKKAYSYEWQILAGSSRVARLSSLSKGERQNILFSLGADVVGPMLLGYIVWILKQVRAHKIKRLYFLSRDGQILLELSKRITEALDIKVDFRYLYGSRQAWHLPAITEIGKFEFEWLLLADPILSIRIFSARAGLDPLIVREQILSAGENWKLDDPLNKAQIQRLCLIIARSELHRLILERAREVRCDVLEYFSQEGLMDDISWGIVDMGWHGNMQDSLIKILKTKREIFRIHGFYFGITRSNIPASVNSEKHAFFFDHYVHKPKVRSCPISNPFKMPLGTKFSSLLEIFTAADHETTLSYFKINDKWYPKLKGQSFNTFKIGNLESLRKGLFRFLSQIPIEAFHDIACNMDLIEYNKRLFEIIKNLYLIPSRSEANALGSYLFSSDQSESFVRPFAPPFSVVDIVRLEIGQKMHYKTFHTCWVEGSLARSDSCSKAVFPFYSELVRYRKLIL